MINGPGINVNWVPGITLEEMEKNCILAAFRFYRGNKTQTAGGLGISIRTLDNKLERYEADARAESERAEIRKRNDAETLARFRGPQLTKQFSTGSSSQWANGEADDGNGISQVETQGRENDNETRKNAPEGASVQPPLQTRTEPGVPVSQRPKVQEVLQRQATHSSNRRNR